MKKFNFLKFAAIILLSSAVIFSACKKDEDDTTAPTITLKGDKTMTVLLNAAFTDPGATASDDEDGDISASITVSGTVTTAKAGTYTMTYSVTDKAGNSATEKRTVYVKITQDNLAGPYSHIDNIGGTSYPAENETINKSTQNADRIIFTKFAGYTNLTPYAVISGNDGRKLYIPEQTFQNCGINQNLTIKVISDTIMVADNAANFTITYKLYEGTATTPANCSSVYTKL